jgi:hypothetical protein
MASRYRVHYEWDAEQVNITDIDPETGEPYNDVQDHNHNDIDTVLSEIAEEGCRVDVVLVRNVGNEDDGLVDRQWAYVEDGKLPEFFEDAYQKPLCRVPQKFHVELRRALERKAIRDNKNRRVV